MNQWISRLNETAKKPERIVLGAISGTSMDGIDLALCRIRSASTETSVVLLEWSELPPDRHLKETFHRLAYKDSASPAELLRLSAELGGWWCSTIREQIKKWGVKPGDVDLLASHGQTLFHHPDRSGGAHATWQVVDGDLLAQRIGVPTISDFRQAHIAAGYEGAPLAPLAESLLFSTEDENRILLNLGGIANFTLLPAGPGQVRVPFATDTGPANTLLDEVVKRAIPGKDFDQDGFMARTGKTDQHLLKEFLAHDFFSRKSPKSTGQEEFYWEWVHKIVTNHNPSMRTEDLLSTLVELTVLTVIDQIPAEVLESDPVLYVSGGGWHNKYMMDRFKVNLPSVQFKSSRDLGLEPDAKEAILFAVLGNEAVAGPGWVNQRGEQFRLGKISLPAKQA